MTSPLEEIDGIEADCQVASEEKEGALQITLSSDIEGRAANGVTKKGGMRLRNNNTRSHQPTTHTSADQIGEKAASESAYQGNIGCSLLPSNENLEKRESEGSAQIDSIYRVNSTTEARTRSPPSLEGKTAENRVLGPGESNEVQGIVTSNRNMFTSKNRVRYPEKAEHSMKWSRDGPRGRRRGGRRPRGHHNANQYYARNQTEWKPYFWVQQPVFNHAVEHPGCLVEAEVDMTNLQMEIPCISDRGNNGLSFSGTSDSAEPATKVSVSDSEAMSSRLIGYNTTEQSVSLLSSPVGLPYSSETAQKVVEQQLSTSTLPGSTSLLTPVSTIYNTPIYPAHLIVPHVPRWNAETDSSIPIRSPSMTVLQTELFPSGVPSYLARLFAATSPSELERSVYVQVYAD